MSSNLPAIIDKTDHIEGEYQEAGTFDNDIWDAYEILRQRIIELTDRMMLNAYLELEDDFWDE